MMKKPHLFSVTNRPLTSTNKKNTLYNTLGNSNNKNTIQNQQRNTPQNQNLQLAKIHQTIDQLISKQKQFQSTGKYVQAQSCKRKVQSLKQYAQKQQTHQTKQRHKRQLIQIQSAHIQQINCFNIQWDMNFKQLLQNVSKMEQQLIKKHQDQTNIILEQINNQKPKNFKESPQLLDLRKIQQQLAKQQNYIEAHKVQKRVQKIQKEQIQKWKKNQQSKGRLNLNALRLRQAAQLSALKQKIQLEIQQKQRQKNKEHQKLVLKYQNVIKQLQLQQNQQLIRMQKSAKLSQNQKVSKPVGYGSTSKASLF